MSNSLSKAPPKLIVGDTVYFKPSTITGVGPFNIEALIRGGSTPIDYDKRQYTSLIAVIERDGETLWSFHDDKKGTDALPLPREEEGEKDSNLQERSNSEKGAQEDNGKQDKEEVGL